MCLVPLKNQVLWLTSKTRMKIAPIMKVYPILSRMSTNGANKIDNTAKIVILS